MVTVTLRAKKITDSGMMSMYFSGTSGITSGRAEEVDRLVPILRNTSLPDGSAHVINPGEKIGIYLPHLNVDVGRAIFGGSGTIKIGNNMMVATGFYQIEIINATTKAVIKNTVATASPVNVNTLTNPSSTVSLDCPPLPIDENLGGIIVALHFLAGGTGQLFIQNTTNVIPTQGEGRAWTQTTGGSTATFTNENPKMDIKGQGAPIGLQDQSLGASSMSYGLRRPYTSGTSGYVWYNYQRFGGITIPQGATINSAIMTLRTSGSGTYMDAYIKAVDDKSFSLPNPRQSYAAAANGQPPGTPNVGTRIKSQLIERTGTVGGIKGQNAVPWLKKTATPTQDSSKLVQFGTGAGTQRRRGDAEENFDVKDLVQNLVNKFNYSDDSMFFNIGLRKGTPTGYSQGGSVFTGRGIYQRIDSIFNKQTIFSPNQNRHVNSGGTYTAPGTTATSQGVSTFVPKLVIDFTAVSPSTDFPFTADSLLFLGAYLRSCYEVDARLIVSGPAHEGFEVAEAILAYLNANGDSTGFVLLASVINPTTGRVYTNHAIKSSIGYLQSTNQITGNPYVPPLPEPGGSFNFKKTTWSIV